MDIYSYLKKDHRKVSDLMEQLLAARSTARREQIFDEINEELTLHADTERATFYAALENEEETEEKIEEAEDDHDEITEYLETLSATPVENAKWLEMFGEFKHAVEHHVKDEEERIFEKARQVLDDDEAEQLAWDMESLKERIMQKAA